MNKPRLLILSGFSELSYPALKNLIEILTPLTQQIFMILEDKKQIKLVSLKSGFEYEVVKLSKLPSNTIAGFILKRLLPILFFLKAKKIDVVLGYQSGASHHALMMLIAKILGKKLLYFMGGFGFLDVIKTTLSFHESVAAKISILIGLIEIKLCFRLVDTLILIHPRLIKRKFYRKYKSKTVIAYDFPSQNFYDHFIRNKEYHKRPLTIAYVGDFRVIKGVYHFAKAIPIILSKMSELQIMFIGDQNLNAQPKNLAQIIKERIKDHMNNVIFTDYVPHHKLPEYYNNLRLVVLPSFSEGFPAVVLEAMTCGTPVVATTVGGIPDIITDGVNGYLLKSNSPKFLAEAIIKILNDKKLPKVAENAYRFIREKYSYEKTVNMWKNILSTIYKYHA